jgi:hypothetical protein
MRIDSSSSVVCSQASVPTTCQVLQADGCWLQYTPDPKSVLIIAAGFNGNARRLHELGFDTTTIYDENYDKYPRSDDDFVNRPIVHNSADEFPKDLASMADKLVLPAIRKLIAEGKGPIMIITGSRGGQVTICRLWRFWHGPSIVLNGGCDTYSAPPQGVPLGLLTQGRDFFQTKSLLYTQRKFSSWPGEVIIYHHAEDDHSVRTYNDAIGLVISLVLDIPKTTDLALERVVRCSQGATMDGRVLMKPRGKSKEFISIWN